LDDAVDRLLTQAASGGRVDMDAAEGIVAAIAADLRGRPAVEGLALASRRGAARYLAAHTQNVIRLALWTGIVAGHDTKELAALGLGALWHDVGMLRVPAWKYLQPRLLGGAPMQEVEAHAADGVELLAAAPGVAGRIVRIVSHVHERSDGSGYPAGLAGDAIDEAARLIAVCDTYEALVSPRVYRPAFHPADAMRIVLGEADAGRLDADAVRDFVQAVGAYPIGCTVKLSDGRSGRVLGFHASAPDRPVVEVTRRRGGRTVDPPERVDLGRERALTVEPLPAA
jgi:HD-GYP domain-containing protein (c-di-GMP phosphodiesterase class II)